jgi:hypothetical protein
MHPAWIRCPNCRQDHEGIQLCAAHRKVLCALCRTPIKLGHRYADIGYGEAHTACNVVANRYDNEHRINTEGILG